MPTVDISRGEYLRWVTAQWPNKNNVCNSMAEWVTSQTRAWPTPSFTVFCSLLVNLGRKVELAKTPEECVDALFHVYEYLRCPEPGWEAADVRFVA